MQCSLSNLVKEVVEWSAVKEDLENLGKLAMARLTRRTTTYRIHITHVTSIYKAARLKERSFVLPVH